MLAPEVIPDVRGTSEMAVQNQVRLRASREGARLWRNNVGAGKLENGKFVRWGLANDSTAVNAMLKSADLIGIRPVPIGDGRIIGQFVSYEIKRPGWKYAGTDREEAQLRWRNLILSLGGEASFMTA